MKTVNLLETSSFQITYRRMLSSALAVVVLAGVGFGLVSWQRSHLEQKINAMQDEVAVLKGKKAKLTKELSSKRRPNIEGLTKLEGYFAELPSWAPLLREIATKMPPDIWLSNIQAEAKDNQVSLVLEGSTSNTKHLTIFLRRLDQAIYIDRPTLSKTSVKVDKGRPSYNFTIGCEVIPL